jgi:hypothetical protein
VAEKLRTEFHYFLSPDAYPELTLELHHGALPATPSVPVDKITETCLIYRLGARKYVDYFGEALTLIDEDAKTISITSLSEERLYELAFLTIYSRAGDFLDRAGFSRLHALAVSYKGTNAVVMLPSRGGKSTLLSHLLENPDIKIIADDMPLVDRKGRILPFPTKISMTDKPESGELAKLNWNAFMRAHYPPKWTATLSALPERLETSPEKNPVILIQGVRLSHGESLISPTPKWQMLGALLEHMIIGMGLPQILEIFLNMNFTDVFKLIHHAILRSWCALALLLRAKTFTFYIGQDKSYNAQLLLNLLSEHES